MPTKEIIVLALCPPNQKVSIEDYEEETQL